MTKDEIAEANRKIRIVLRKHGFQSCASPTDGPLTIEIWRGNIDGVPLLVEVRSGMAGMYAGIAYNTDSPELEKVTEELASTEI